MKFIGKQTVIHGFTLIELMMALALGAFVITISIALYQHAKQAYIDSGRQLSTTERLSVSQNLLKEALAGSIDSCNAAPIQQSIINSSKVWLQAGRTAAQIYPPRSNIRSFKKIGTQIGERSAESDVLLLRPAVLPATAIISHDRANNRFIAQNSIGLTRGRLAIVCNQNAAVIFQVAYTTGRHIHYARPGVAPGNCARAFTSERCGGDYQFGKDALLAHYKPSVFYIANGYAGPALYRQKPIVFRQSGTNRLSLRAQEMVSHITQLHAAVNRATDGRSTQLIVQFTIAGDANTKPQQHEKYFYTLPL